MTHFLRNGDETIVDVETTDTDIRCVVDIKEYTDCFLAIMGSGGDKKLYDMIQAISFSQDMAWLQNLRRDWFEGDRKQSSREFVTQRMKPMANKWNLYYVED